jgi:hypothetical protein
MGTRSLTFVYENNGTKEVPIMNMYRQFDGYPGGHGADLVDFLSGGNLVNGIGVNKNVFNGMGCLAAQLIAKMKDGAGGIYIYSVDTKNCGQDYEYHIYEDGDGFKIKVFNCGVNFFGLTQSDKHDKIFEGDLYKFAEFCSGTELA